MGKELRYDGRVAIVTGAGQGLGRTHAMLLASRGAKVVVNDLGGAHTGGGASSAVADEVVQAIKAAGGEAVANYDSVEDGAKIVQTALDAFGRVDIVINNAGILRDKTFANMTEQDWDLIYRVHVLGSFRVTQAAWPHMREQKFGRIVMTASAAGIYGNFGQANYSMAKLGLAGFASTLALEGERRNIHVNTIAPIAGSRMTETVLPPELIAALKPEYVTPLVAYLCHEDTEENGGLFEVGGGFYGKLRWERTEGASFRLGRDITPENVRDAWPVITDFSKTQHPASVTESMGVIMDNVSAGPSRGGNQFIDLDQALGYAYPDSVTAYDERDMALYALGIGAASNPTDSKDLQLVFEMHGGGFRPFPTFAVTPPINALVEDYKSGKTAPGLNYGLDRLLHGEQFLEVKRPLPPHAKLTHKARITDIFDKGKGALVITTIDSFDEDGDLLFTNVFTAFIRGAGGWGGERGPSADVNVPPERAPDTVTQEAIPENQALLYRLSGDINPLHADPGFANAFGYEKPILHGLCSFGFAVRHVINAYAGGDPRYFKNVKVRFAGHVFPGETLITRMWKESDTRIIFECSVKERESVVISNAAIELYAEIPKKQPKAKAPKAVAAAAAAPAELTSGVVFKAIGTYLQQNPGLKDRIKCVYLFKLNDPASTWTVDLKDKSTVVAGDQGNAECTLELTDADFMDMTSGKADPQKLFFGGQLKISGNIMASQKLDFLQKLKPSDIESALAAAPAVAAPAPTPAAKREPVAPAFFEKLSGWLSSHADRVAGEAGEVQFAVSDPDGAWVLDLGTAAVRSGQTDTPVATLSLSDAMLGVWAGGKESARALFQRGALRVDGDLRIARKLDFFGELS